MASKLPATLSIPSYKLVLENEDLLTEIIVRIPTKSVVGLRCVCKRWNSIVSTSHWLSRTHTRFHPPNTQSTSGVFVMEFTFDFTDDSNYYYFSLPSGRLSPSPFKFPSSHKILQSCNGLMLLLVKPNIYWVYNPLTCQYKTLPLLIVPQTNRVFEVSLAFDPSRFHGFRVVCIAFDTDSSCWKIFRYCSSGPNNWKEWEGTGVIAKPTECRCIINTVYHKGVIHWIMTQVSLYFSVVNESFGTFPSPPWIIRQFCEFDGKLHCVTTNPSWNHKVTVYVLKGYAEGWYTKYKVDIGGTTIRNVNVCQRSTFWLVVCEEGDQRWLQMMVHNFESEETFLYNLKRKTWRVLRNLSSIKWNLVHPFTATLALL